MCRSSAAGYSSGWQYSVHGQLESAAAKWLLATTPTVVATQPNGTTCRPRASASSATRSDWVNPTRITLGCTMSTSPWSIISVNSLRVTNSSPIATGMVDPVDTRR